LARHQSFLAAVLAFGTLMSANLAVAADSYNCSQTTYDDAKTRVQALFGLGGLVADHGPPLGLFIKDDFWDSMTFPEKSKLAKMIVCAVAGPGKGLTTLRFRSLSTGKTLATWNVYRLVPADE